MAGRWTSPFEARHKNKERNMKKGLNKMDVAKYHKWLKQGVSKKKIAKALHTTMDVLEGLTPEKVAGYNKQKKTAEKKVQEQKQSNRLKADILVETAAKVMAGQPVNPGAPATPAPALGEAPMTDATPKEAPTPTGAVPTK